MGGPRFAPDLLGAPERRYHSRVALPQPATVDLGLCRGATLLDASQGGLGVWASCHPVPGIVTSLSLVLPRTVTPIQTMATVAWTDGSGRMGLAFHRLSEDHRRQLEQWISQPPLATSPDQAEEPRGSAGWGEAAIQVLPADSSDFAWQTAVTLETAMRRVSALTGATGAAVAMERAGAMICVATWGNAPALNTPVDPQSDLSGECIRTCEVVRCEDTENDPRANRLLSWGLHLRSIVIVPVRRYGRAIGIIQMYSSAPHAFDDTHVAVLTRLGDEIGATSVSGGGAMPVRTESLDPPAQLISGVSPEGTRTPPAAPQQFPAPESSPVGAAQISSAQAAAAKPAVSEVVAAVRSTIAVRSATVPASARAQTRPWQVKKKTGGYRRAFFASPQPSVFQRTAGVFKILVRSALVVWFTTALLLGSLLAYRHITRRTPETQTSAKSGADPVNWGGSTALGTRIDDATAYVRALFQSTRAGWSQLKDGADTPRAEAATPQHLTGGRLLDAVEPAYPEAARKEGLRGPVILRVEVGKNGRVQRMEVLRGSPLLVTAAQAAVRRWRFEPFRVDGQPIEMQTVVTVPFAVPQP